MLQFALSRVICNRGLEAGRSPVSGKSGLRDGSCFLKGIVLHHPKWVVGMYETMLESFSNDQSTFGIPLDVGRPAPGTAVSDLSNSTLPPATLSCSKIPVTGIAGIRYWEEGAALCLHPAA